MLKKCDILIPIYNAPEWVKLCVYSLIINTSKKYINKIYLLDDNSNFYTKNCLSNLKEKYPDVIEYISNKENLGFVKNCNKGLQLSMKDKNSDCVLLLNSDCLVSKNSVSKLMEHANKNEKVGLICPISSNAANLTFDMLEGFNYNQMNELFEKKFLGMTFDACTVVGNCLLITKKCIEKIGYLDEIFGMGYGEETDYHFRALSYGFEAKVAIDTYVFHKSEASFGTSKEKQEKLNANRKIFFERWRKDYEKCLKKYSKNDPIVFIQEHLTEEDKKPLINALFYLPDIHQNAGGCHVVTDLVNYMAIHNYTASILYDHIVNYKEIMLFNPIHIKSIDKITFKQIIATVWASVYPAYKIAMTYNVPLVNFVQGYEEYFENGNVYGLVELSYKLADANLVISDYLKEKLFHYFDVKPHKISNSIHYDLLKHKNTNKNPKTFLFILRGSVMKGDFLLLDVIKMLDKKYKEIVINVVYMNPYIEFPYSNFTNNNEINYIKGPLERTKIHSLLSNTDIYVDASINEGFGLTALEAMAAGAVPIVSNSFGVLEYMNNSENGFVINEVNDAEKYLEKIDILLANNKMFIKMKKECEITASKYDYDNNIVQYIKYFTKCEKLKKQVKKFNEEEDKMIQSRYLVTENNGRTKNVIYRFNRFIPNKVKQRIKRIITTIYNSYQH